MIRALSHSLVALLACGALTACNDLPNRGRYAPPAESFVAGSRAAIDTAVADQARPTADRERDAARKPAEILAFARVGPDQRVVDFLPGGGYFTRLFSRAVGAGGRVTAFLPAEAPAQYVAAIRPVSDDEAAFANVDLVQTPSPTLTVGEPQDLVFTAQNYHDLHAFGSDVAAFNRNVFSALRPGGLYVVVDHSGTAGTGTSQAGTLHRIEQATVRSEIEAAGFVFDAESNLLRNPADPRTANVFDPVIRGRTDQFIMRFRKPLPR